MTRQSRASLRARSGQGLVGGAKRKVGQLVRRLRISASSGALWVLSGASDFDGNVESERAEAFEGIGFASRPAAGDNAEAIVAKVGGESGHPVIVATRNRDAFKNLESEEGLAEDESALYNSSAMVKASDDGFVDLGSIGGTRQPFATLEDVVSLKEIFTAWVTAPNDGGAALKTLLDDWEPAGTKKVRGE